MNPLRAIKSVTFLQNIQHFRIRNVRKMYSPILNFISYQNKANVVPPKVDYLISIAARSQTLKLQVDVCFVHGLMALEGGRLQIFPNTLQMPEIK